MNVLSARKRFKTEHIRTIARTTSASAASNERAKRKAPAQVAGRNSRGSTEREDHQLESKAAGSATQIENRNFWDLNDILDYKSV